MAGAVEKGGLPLHQLEGGNYEEAFTALTLVSNTLEKSLGRLRMIRWSSRCNLPHLHSHSCILGCTGFWLSLVNCTML